RAAFFITSTLLAFSLIILLLVHFSLELLIGQKFQSAIEYIPWICGAYTVNGCYSVYNQVLIFKSKSIVISSITLFSILTGAVFSIILIKFHGAIGAAEAFFLTLLLRSFLTFLYSNKILSLNS
ncbi:hypothetical protein, partial [Polynucleobacter sp. MWH-Jannik1A5]|uniref:hypothetical protein n=1 Tax=Polynucleobacter sp. MWH-Jannik1A5 TaxID=1855890 RepID=UPI001C0E5068